jgi:hypothetical protein
MEVGSQYDAGTNESSGTMSPGRQTYHACTTALMCGLFVAIMLLAGRFLLPLPGFQASGALLGCAIFFEIAAAGAIVLQVRDYCRIVRQFEYNGQLLRFWTLGSSQAQNRELSQIVDILQGRARAPSIGFALVFKDGKKAYLDYSLPNARSTAERLRLDLHGRPALTNSVLSATRPGAAA